MLEQEKNNGKTMKRSAATASWWQPAVEIFAQVTSWIAGPIIIALFIGKWLDKRYLSEPWLFLLSIATAFAISSFGIVRITLNYIKKIEQEAKDKKAEDVSRHAGAESSAAKTKR